MSKETATANNTMGVIVQVEADKSKASQNAFSESVKLLAQGIHPKITLDIDKEATRSRIQDTLKSILSDMGVAIDDATTKAIKKASSKESSKKSSENSKKSSSSKSDLSQYKAKIKELQTLQHQIETIEKINSSNNISLNINTDDAQARLVKIKTEIKNLKTSLTKAGVSKSSLDDISSNAISFKNVDASAMEKISSYGQKLGRAAADENSSDIAVQKQRIMELAAAYNLTKKEVDLLSDSYNAAKTSAENMSSATLKSASQITNDFKKYTEKNPRIFNDSGLSDKVNEIKANLAQVYDFESNTIKMKVNDTDAKEAIKNAKDGFAELRASASGKGLEGKTVLDKIAAAFEKFGGWSLVTRGLTSVWHECKEVYNNVVLVDSAMTKLKKVTDETSATYDRFLDGAATRAKTLGATLEDVVTSTADYARLGYNLSEATQLADSSIVYKNVGDGITDITDASESIISTMKAFNIEAKNSMDIVDKYNEIDNNFAISSGGVGEAMKRSAAALAAANNDIDESIGLITAMNTVIQDPEKVGTTLKTVSMYLRASKTEAEEAGISTDGMAESVSKLREEISALTGNRVDIMADDSTYKSTYQILKEISEVWDDLSDVSQANLTEKLAGKRNSNALLAVLKNFNIAEEAMQKSKDAAGSALAENEKYLDSIQGRMDVLEATFQEFSITVLSSEVVKGAVSFLGTVLGGLNDVVSTLGVIPSILMSIAAALTTVKVLGNLKVISTDTKVLGTTLSAINKVGSTLKAVSAMSAETGTSIVSTIGQLSGLGTAGVAALGTAGAVVAGIAVAAWGVQKHYENIKKAADDAAQNLNETDGEIAEVQNQISLNRQQINELLSSGLDSDSSRVKALEEENSKLEAQLELYKSIRKEQLAEQVSAESKEFTAQRYNTKTGEQTNSLLYAGTDILTAYESAKTTQDNAKRNMANLALKGYKGDSRYEYFSDLLNDQDTIMEKYVLAATQKIDKLDEYRNNSNAEWTSEMQSAYDTATAIVSDYYANIADSEDAIRYLRTADEYQSAFGSLDTFADKYSRIDGVDELADQIKNGLNPSFRENKDVIMDVIASDSNLRSKAQELGVTNEELAESIWESINGFNQQGTAADNAAAALEDAKNAAANLSDSIGSLNDAYDLLNTAQEELSEYGNLSAGTLQSILEKYPQLTDEVYRFMAGQVSATELIQSMSGAYNDVVDEFNQGMINTLENSKAFYSALTIEQKNAIDALAESYGVDLQNVNTVEDAKYQIRKKYLMAWMELLGLNEKSSKNSVLQELNEAQKRLTSAQMSGASNSEIAERQQMVNELKALYSTYDTLDTKFKDIAFTGAKGVYTPSQHLNSSYKSSGSSGSSGKSEEDKALDAAKKAFDAEHDILENKLKRDLISERDYYNQLEALYKKYFAANTEYYLDYEAKVYEGRKKLLEDAKGDVDDLLDMVVDSIKDAKKAEKEALEDYLDDLEDLADKRKEALDDLKDETDYLKKLANMRKSVADLENRLADAKLDNSAAGVKRQLELEEDLKSAKDELTEYEYEHSVEAQKEAIDKELEVEKEKVNKQIEALDNFLDNQNSLVTEAWAQIEGMNDSLYQKLIDWNKKYGSAIDQDVIDKWNAAKDALSAYGSVYKAQKTYEQMSSDISNKKAPAGNGSGSGSSASSNSSGGSAGGSSASSSISSGSRVKASSSAKIYTGINGQAKNQYFKNNPTYTVLQVKDGWVKVRHSSLNSGVTGWFKKSDLTAYARGTSSVPHDGIFVTQDAGQEAIMHNGGLITPLSKGDMVFNNKASKRLWELSNSPNDNWFIDGLKEQFGITDKGSALSKSMIQQDNSVNVSFGDMYINGNTDESVFKQLRKDLTSDVIKAINGSHAKRGNTLRPIKSI